MKNKIPSRKNRVTARVIKKATQGVLNTLIDVVILESIVFHEFLFNPQARTMGGLGYAVAKKLDELDNIETEACMRALKKARTKGWIDKDFRPTKEGKAKLENVINIDYKKPKQWNKKWYLVIFDVPEEKRRLRDALREKLKILGFGMLQASVWISPYPSLGDVEEIVKFYHLKPYVLYAVSKKVGRYNSKELASQVWELEKINKKYKEFLEQYEKLGRGVAIKDLNQLKFEYLSILQLDPQLPFDLLSKDWLGEKAHRIYKKILSLINKKG